MKKIFETAMRTGTATVFAIGLAVVLAAVLGVASTALAANGKPFLLGKSNVATAVSKLVKSGAGPALELRVGSGPPLRVNSGARVANLNSDKVDGKDASAFIPSKTYKVFATTQGPGGGQVVIHSAFCDEGDQVLSGGGGAGGSFFEDPLLTSDVRGDLDGWFLTLRDNGNPSPITVTALCADFPPLRP